MVNWNLYGNVISTYQGSGNLLISDRIVPCDFEIGQLSNGNIYAICNINNPLNKFLLINNSPDKLVGKTIDGLEITFTGNLIINYSKGDTISILGQNAIINTLESAETGSIEFAFVNLVLDEGPIEFECNGYKISIRPIETYDNVIFGLKASKGIAITSMLRINITLQSDIKMLEEFVDDICMLLSLCQGCRVTWLYYLVINGKGKFVKRYHKNAVTKPYTSLILIPLEDTINFIIITYPKLVEKKNIWQLRKAIEAYTDAKIETDFLEARALKLVVVLEYLKACYFEKEQKEFILTPQITFDDKVDKLIFATSSILKEQFPKITLKQLELMTNNLKGLNRYPFSRALSEICDDVKLKIASKERRKYIELRNEIVHRLKFLPENANGKYFQQYVNMMDFVGRLFLAILEYDGYYLDWQNLNKQRKLFSIIK